MTRFETAHTFEIADLDGGNRRTVTLAQFLLKHEAVKGMAAPIMAAWKRGDMAGVEMAQAALRKAVAS